ncbi:MAG: translation initiation factor IF-2, partial [Clostridia bacterium]|nr:translation initiation factor IF-2 [Clostridia bacterium]
LGFEEVPNAGDSIFAVTQDLMKSVIEERKRKESDERGKVTSKVSFDDMFGGLAAGNKKILNLIIKGDVQGSVEAIKQSVLELSDEEVEVKVIHSGAGAITESDVMLAESSSAIILGFNVRPDAKARVTAERSKVDVRSYRIIYDLLDDMKAALKGMYTPKYQDVYIGKCEVRQTFKITGVGTVAGCYVTDGKIIRGGKLRIYRDDVLVVEGNVKQLKRFKDDVKEVAYNYECGCAIDGFNDIKVGDIIECYTIEEIDAK